MKNLVILGASRAGKTTLAKEINKVYPNYHIVFGDSIRKGFQDALPQNDINEFGGEGMKEDFAKYCASYFKNQIRRVKREEMNINYIFDSCDVSVENALKYFNEENIIIVFLGYANIDEKQALKNYRNHEKRSEWTADKTDEELLIHANTWINNSKIFKEQCEQNSIRYIDTSFDREQVLLKLKEELIEELKC